MKKNIQGLSLSVFALSLFTVLVPTSYAALSINTNLDTSGGASISSGSQVSGQVSAGSNASQNPVMDQNQVSGSVISGATSSSGMDANQAAATNDTSSSASSGVNAQVSANAILDADTPILMLRSDVDGANNTVSAQNTQSASAQNQATVSDPAAVSNSDTLSAYAHTSIQNDPNVDSIGIKDNEVDVSYRQDGKLFGFIPVSVDANTTVNADGSVKVHYPWYRFLVGLDQGSVKADLETKLQTTMPQPQVNSSGTAYFTVSEEAQVLSQIQTYMKAHESASANASATGGAYTQ